MLPPPRPKAPTPPPSRRLGRLNIDVSDRKRIKFKGRLAGFLGLMFLAICHLFSPKFVESFLND